MTSNPTPPPEQPTTPCPLTPQLPLSIPISSEIDPETHTPDSPSGTKLIIDDYNIILRNPFRFQDGDSLKAQLDRGDSFTLTMENSVGQYLYARQLALLELSCTFFCSQVGEGRDVKYAFHPFNRVKVVCESMRDGEWHDLNDMTLDRYFKRDARGDWRDETTGALMRSAVGDALRRADSLYYHGYTVARRPKVKAKVVQVDGPPTRGKEG